MSRIWLLATVIAAASEKMPTPGDSKNALWFNVVGSIIAGVILLIVVYLIRRKLAPKIEERRSVYRELAQAKMRELRKAIRARKPPAVQSLMALTACQTAIHLTDVRGESIRLEEYGELLERSLTRQLRKCTFIALTRPSDWYAPGDIGERMRAYFQKQWDLRALNKRMDKKFSICRYLVLDRSTYDKNAENKADLIADHKKAEIPLYFCDTAKLDPYFVQQINDIAIFEDAAGWQWVVEGMDFSSDTISRHTRELVAPTTGIRNEDRQDITKSYYSTKRVAPTVTVRIVDRQDNIQNSYSTIVTTLSRIAERQR